MSRCSSSSERKRSCRCSIIFFSVLVFCLFFVTLCVFLCFCVCVFFCILNISKDHMFITCDGCRSGRIPGHRQPKIRAECRMCSVIHFILLMT